MKRVRLALSLGVWLALVGGPAWSAGPSPAPRLYGQPCCPPGQYLPAPCPQPLAPTIPPKEPGKGPDAIAPPAEPAISTDALAQAPEAGGGTAPSAQPAMFGDLIGPQTLFSLTGSTSSSRLILGPVASRGAFKIADNESPRPVTRVFISYNYFNHVLDPVPGLAVPNTDLHREIIGFERTFLSGNASFGMRLPFLQITGFDAVEDSFVGDLTMILKFALINDPDAVLSGGLVVTVPTGQDNLLLGPVHSTLLQPWVGGIYGMGPVYAQMFSSIIIPTNSRDVTIWFNDIGLGWFMYRSNAGLLTSVVPTGEVHVNTPLTHRDGSPDCVQFIDSVNLTGGVYWGLGERLLIGTAVGFPVTGPHPFDIEGIVNVNFRF